MTATEHILTVTRHSDHPDDTDLYFYEIECPGVTDVCREWRACPVINCLLVGEHKFTVTGRLAHGRRHMYINGMWMVGTDHCYVQNHDGMPDAVAGQFQPGRYVIDFDFDTPDDGDIRIFANSSVTVVNR